MPAAVSRALLLAGAVLGVLAIGARAAGIWVNLSGSLPIGLYRTTHGPIVRGSIVVVCLPESVAAFALEREYLQPGSCPGGVEPLGKTVAALEGDTVAVRADGVWVNGHLLMASRPLIRDSRGRLLPRLVGWGRRLSVREVALVATRRPGSFDSRYFGEINISLVRAILMAVFPGSAAESCR